MAKIERTFNHSLGLDAAKNAASKLIDGLKEKYGALISDVKWNEDKSAADLKGKGFSGNLKLTDKEVHVAIELGFLASPFKGKVEEELDKHANDFNA
jgi:putative polyhydroxyalkanoate system protein